MKKAIVSILIAAVLMAFLVGCGGGGSSSGSGFQDIEVSLPNEIESGELESSGDGFSEIETVTFDGDLTMELQMPDYGFSEITLEGVTLTVPEIDYVVSSDRIESAYGNTYTLPDIQIEIPDFDNEVLEGVYVSVADNLTLDGQQQLAEMSDAEFARVASIQLSLADKLMNAIKAAGITLAVDPMSGAIPIDATTLFDSDSYELKPEGKAALKEVFTIYCGVISQPEFKGAIASIVIEGHTDTDGSHEYNQELSEKRAEAVREFLLSDECGLPNREYLASLLTTVGRSYDDPVYAADGTVDMAASRRVEIRFTPNLDQ